MLDEALVSELHASIVHLDLKGMVGVVISNSLLLYCPCFQPFSTVWALDDNSVTLFKLVDGSSSLLLVEVELMLITFLTISW